MADCDKGTNLLRDRINYGHNNFITKALVSICKTFFASSPTEGLNQFNFCPWLVLDLLVKLDPCLVEHFMVAYPGLTIKNWGH